MTDPHDNLIRRIARVEAELTLLRNEVREQDTALGATGTDARAARVLAAGADRDVSELREEMRAHTRALNALRQTQVELHTQTQQAVEAVDAKLTAGLAETRAGFQIIADMIARITPQE